MSLTEITKNTLTGGIMLVATAMPAFAKSANTPATPDLHSQAAHMLAESPYVNPCADLTGQAQTDCVVEEHERILDQSVAVLNAM